MRRRKTPARNRPPQWTGGSLIPAFVSLVLLSLVPQSHAQDPPRSPVYVLYHVFGDKSGPPTMPKELAKFSKTLQKVGVRFALAAKPIPLSLHKGKSTVKLPRGLGSGEIELVDRGQGTIEVTLRPQKPKDKNDCFRSRLNRFPIYLIDDKRFKVGNTQYIFILDRVSPTKP